MTYIENREHQQDKFGEVRIEFFVKSLLHKYYVTFLYDFKNFV